MFVKNISTIFIIFMLLATPVFALELDTSVDDEIRRTYDPSKLEQSLPALPKTAPTQQNTVSKTPQTTQAPKTAPKSLPSTPVGKPQLGVKKLPNEYKFDK